VLTGGAARPSSRPARSAFCDGGYAQAHLNLNHWNPQTTSATHQQHHPQHYYLQGLLRFCKQQQQQHLLTCACSICVQ
jgi:hypothetical protein